MMAKVIEKIAQILRLMVFTLAVINSLVIAATTGQLQFSMQCSFL